MSKSVPVKLGSQPLQKNHNPIPAVHKSGLPMMPEPRDVSALPVSAQQNGMLVAYKDLNENTYLQLRKQKQQMLFAFSLFLLVGLLILAGQVISKPRMIAASSVGMQVGAVPTHVEHYQYDKSCYTGDNGEQVCVTRTSRK
jgi:hypothetical protein